MQRAAFAQRNPYHAPLSGLCRFADGFRHLARLAVTEAHPASLVANNNERRKSKASPAFYNFRDAIYGDKFVDKFGIAVFA
jgi:hypothetical protein